MARKLSDSEFAERARASNRRRTERHQQKQVLLGKSSLTVWIPDSLRAALAAKATADGATIQDTATAVLSAGLGNQGEIPKHKEKPDPDLFSEPEPAPVDTDPAPVDTDPAPLLTKEERDRQILELHRQGVSNPEIGKRFGTTESSVRRALKRIKQAVH